MAKILCIEDSDEFVIYLKSVLEDYDLTVVRSLTEAYAVLGSGSAVFDLVLLDVELPDGNGIRSLSTLKNYFVGRMTPFFILTSDDDILSKVAAFGLGVEDYVLKGTNPMELTARISAKMRSNRILQKQADHVAVGDLVINSEKMQVEICGADGKNLEVDLTPLEFKVLKLLSTRPDQVYSRNQLIDYVWGVGKFITERTVDAHVSHLRKKIVKSRAQITTVVNVGYKLEIKSK